MRGAVKPVGLTRAEEAAQQQGFQERVTAPLGTVRCRVNVPGVDCKAAATVTVVWKDGDRAPSCAECALQMQQHVPGAIVHIETIVDNR